MHRDKEFPSVHDNKKFHYNQKPKLGINVHDCALSQAGKAAGKLAVSVCISCRGLSEQIRLEAARQVCLLATMLTRLKFEMRRSLKEMAHMNLKTMS